jgi:hypothetical protein
MWGFACFSWEGGFGNFEGWWRGWCAGAGNGGLGRVGAGRVWVWLDSLDMVWMARSSFVVKLHGLSLHVTYDIHVCEKCAPDRNSNHSVGPV